METFNLQDGLLFYHKNFLPPHLSSKLFSYLKEKIKWIQEMGNYGRPFPRLTAWFADEGLKYSYSGVTHTGIGWDKILEEVRNKTQKVAQTNFNSLLINYYRDGKDSIGWHADDEKELGENPIVASISLGTVRDFRLKHKKGAKVGKMTLPLEDGSLLVMAGTTQAHWLHSVPKTEEVGERINLTFREIKNES